MAEVRLADVYNPLVFNQGVQEQSVELNAFLASGVAVEDSRLTAQAVGPGNIGDVPFYTPMGNPQSDGTNEPNYTSDDPAVTSTPQKISDGLQKWRKAMMHNSWSTMDLARELALADPLGAIISGVAKYWATNTEQRIIQSAMGVLADNVANDAGDMVHNIATDAVGAPTAAELISGDAVIAAKSTMGDHAEKLTVIAMHSVVYSSLQSQQLIDFEMPAGVPIRIPFYLGYRVVVDDNLPAVSGTNRITYTSILFAGGAFVIGQGRPTVPSEVDRVAEAGNGGGQDILHSRDSKIIHPMGFSFESAAVGGQSPTFAELATATNWNRVFTQRKNIGIAFLQTNG